LTPNLIFDRTATERLQQQAIADLKRSCPGGRGQTIIEPGTRVTPEQYEMLVPTASPPAITERRLNEGCSCSAAILLVLAMVIASVFYNPS